MNSREPYVSNTGAPNAADQFALETV